MGNTVSVNDINDAISISISSFNTSAQNCSGGQSQVVNVNFASCGNINLKDLHISQIAKLNTDCIQKAMITSSQQSQIISQMTQLAQSISQNLDLNPGTTEASNIVSICLSLSMNIVNTISQECTLSNNQVVNFNVNNQGTSGCIPPNPQTGQHDYAGITAVGIYIDQAMQAQLNCVLNSSIVSNQVQQLSQYISQIAKATVQNAIAWIILAIAVLVAALSLFARAKGPVAWVIAIILLLLIVGAFFLIGYLGKKYKWFYIWPFKKEQHKDDRSGIYSFPSNFDTQAALVILSTAYNYLNTCDIQTWAKLRPLMFPDIPSNLSDEQAAISLLENNKNLLANISASLPIPPTGPCPPNVGKGCICACSACKKEQQDPSACNGPCIYNYCPTDNDSSYDSKCNKK